MQLLKMYLLLLKEHLNLNRIKKPAKCTIKSHIIIDNIYKLALLKDWSFPKKALQIYFSTDVAYVLGYS